jgi:hypothetical protein
MSLPRAATTAAGSNDPVQRDGSGTPLSSWLPRSSATNNPATWRCTRAVTTTVSGSASVCARAASFGTSPKTSPVASTTTGPESTATRAQAPACRCPRSSCSDQRAPAVSPAPPAPRARRRSPVPEDSRQRHQPFAELLGDFATHLRHRRRSRVEISSHKVAPYLGVEPCGDAGRVRQIAKHHRHMPALAAGCFGRKRSHSAGLALAASARRRRMTDGRRSPLGRPQRALSTVSCGGRLKRQGDQSPCPSVRLELRCRCHFRQSAARTRTCRAFRANPRSPALRRTL